MSQRFIPGVLEKSQLEQNKKAIISLLRKVNRPGMDNVISYLEKTTFFEAPSGIGQHRHHNWTGGLAQHSLEVYFLLKDCFPGEDAIIVALLHDICKANVLVRNPQTRRWEHRHRPMHYKGHGYRSVCLLERMLKLKLTDVERMAILHHMHLYKYHNDDVLRARQQPLCEALVHCDHQSASQKRRATMGEAYNKWVASF